ncbi:sensor histidine kinase [Auraticoccus monumenti]|uniref:Two-component system, NarL family, sensor histidine kinase DesK n=1 Tax=Auraticoccus monumenti TaxID=675864 RepID=A0A1G6UC33_9ACTN|nr:histidine kinase [Auraticoccus monumenti]SDD38809.1 two-component system, NarL family, sensor histidine kinase DesK [Auraticoccus monumenti]
MKDNPGALRRSTERFVAYVHWSVYVIMATELFAGLQMGVDPRYSGPPLAAAMLLVLVHTATNVAWLRWSLLSVRTSAGMSGRLRVLLGLWLGLTVLTLAAIPLTMPLRSSWPSAMLVVVAISVAAFSPRLAWWLAVGVPVVAAVVLLLVISPISSMTVLQNVVSIVVLSLMMAFVAGTVWLSGWMLRVLYALDDARGQSARLAIAEERLRISRDLHDVFGRTLTTVVVKSELAAELARRGRSERAAEEMSQVRGIAEDASKEVRRIVAGVRSSDLPQELVGARSLLVSAGIECVLVNELPEGRVDAEVGDVLGAVVREAVTNVIRHSRARSARITLRLVDGPGSAEAELVVVNDGVRTDGERSAGSGLIGMAERLTAVGGSLRHAGDAHTFTLTARAPLTATAPTSAGTPSPPATGTTGAAPGVDGRGGTALTGRNHR